MTGFASEYGEGLYELASEEQLTGEIYSELKLLRHAFEEQPEFISLLSNRALGLEERLGIIDNAFKDRLNTYLINFLKLLCGRDAMHEFGRCVEVFTEHYNADHKVSAACVTTARPLTEQQCRDLTEKLKQMTGHDVLLSQKIDAGLLGGVVLEMDGKRWDNTIKQRLETLKKQISGEEE